jgi:hypothetical protein
MAISTEVLNQLDLDRDKISAINAQFLNDNRYTWRVKTILDRNPYMADNMGAVLDMANMPIDDNELFANTGAMYGMQSADLLAKQLLRYSPSVQRSIFSGLTPGQQNTLKQMGYAPPKSDVDEGGFFERTLGATFDVVGEAAGFVASGIGRKVMPVVEPALNLLAETSNLFVGRPYRTIRQLSNDAQLVAILGGIATAGGALALAPITGGVSLAAAAATVGLLGGTATSLAQQAVVGNADDWFNAWSKADNGEKLFTDGGVRRASEILGDPRLVNMAQRMALLTDDRMSIGEIAQEVAGVRDSGNPATQQKQITQLAKELATEGTPEYQAVYNGLTTLLADPLFLSAVEELEQSKISIGRDTANLLGLDPDSDAYRWISGSVDAASLFVLDPFLLAGKAAKVVAMSRRGLQNLDSAAAATRFRQIAERPEMRRKYEVFAEAINSGSSALAKRYTPDLVPIWNEVLTHAKSDPDLATRVFTADDFVDWVVGSNQMRSIMQGVGMVKGVSYGAMKGLNSTQYALRTATGALSDFMKGASDVGVEKLLKRLDDNPQALEQLLAGLPSEVQAQFMSVTSDELPKAFSTWVRQQSAQEVGAYQLGRAASVIPGVKTVANLFDNMQTLSPRGTIIAIDSLQKDSIADLDAFIDLMKVAGVPSYVREIWKRGIYNSPDVPTRLNLLTSMVDTVASATGIRSTLAGSDMLDNVMLRFKQHYALGKTGRFTLRRSSPLSDIDDIPIGTLPEADMATLMQIPDLKAMRQAVKQGTFMRVLVGVSDSTPVNAFQNKYWKPAVLIRFGFVVRNGTEDMLAFLSRAGAGHLAQSFAGRAIAQGKLWDDSLKKISPQTTYEFMGENIVSKTEGVVNAYLTQPEQWALNRRYDVPAHMRPVLRVVERFGSSGSPAISYLSEYGKWMRTRLSRGAGYQKVYQKPLGDAVQDTVERSSLLTNFYQNLDYLAYGNERSIRRLILGGANPDVVRAAEGFESVFFPSIMQRVGASSYLPWQTTNDGEQIVTRKVTDRKGQTKEVAYRIRIAGERTLIKNGTKKGINDVVNVEDFHESILREVTRLTDDGPATRILSEVLKVYDDDMFFYLPPDQLLPILTAWDEAGRAMYGKGPEQFMRLISVVLEARPNVNRFRAIIDNLPDFGTVMKNITTGEIYDPLMRLLKESYSGDAMPTLDNLRQVWAAAIDIANDNNSPIVNTLIELQKYLYVGSLIEDVKTPAARMWLLANLSRDAATSGQHLNKGGLTLKEALQNVQMNTFNYDDLPFYETLESAKTSGVDLLIDEINQGQWEFALGLNRDYVPGAPGTKFFVVQTGPSLPQATPGAVDNVLFDLGYMGPFDPEFEEFAQLLGVDLSALSATQKEGFEKFVYSYLYSLQQGTPFVVGNEAVAKALYGLSEKIHNHFGFIAPKVRKTWLPVAETEDIVDVYPDMLDRVVTRSIGIPSTLEEGALVSGVDWDVQSYPFPEQFLEEARKLTYPNNIINRLSDDIDQRIRGGRRTKVVVRDNESVYQNINGQAVELPAGTVIDEITELFEDIELKKPLGFDNLRMLKDVEVTYEGNENIMWSILAPILYDQSEELAQSVLRTVKNFKTVRASSSFEKAGYKVGEEVMLPQETLRVRASDLRDVGDTPAELLPDWQLAQQYEPVAIGKWDSFVQSTFNEVFSPILDAIARRPMAFHSFLNAHSRNMKSVSWLFRGSEEEAAVNNIISKGLAEQSFFSMPETVLPRYVEAGRALAQIQNVPEFIYWNDQQVISFLRSLDDADLANMETLFQRAIADGRLTMNKAQGTALAKFIQDNQPQLKRIAGTSPIIDGKVYGDTAWEFIDQIDGMFGNGSARAGRIMDPQIKSELRIRNKPKSARRFGDTELDDNDFRIAWAKTLQPEDWEDIRRAALAREKAYETAQEYAAEYAIRDIMPYIDTHEVRSQFADWARGYLPFWYAEENFLKRWARIFTLEGPAGSLARARKLQLTANGLRTMGIVREDPNGNSYFVYPGSDLLIETVGKIPGLKLLPVSAMLQTPTDRMIPGFNPQFGAPGFSPLVGLPLEFITLMFPESTGAAKFQRNIMGDLSVNSNVLGMILPAQVVNTFKAVYEFTQPYESTGYERISSAMMTAIAHLEATGQGLTDNPQANEVDEFLRKVRNHARVVVLSQALAGWFTPGPAQALQVPEGQNSLSFLTEGQIENPQEILSSTFFELIKNLGIEEGTAAYLERFPDNTINDVLEPIAYTVSRTESVSGAPLPRSEDGINFYVDNKDLLDQYPFAGPWLLPQDAADLDEDSQYAYDAQLINGLRTRKTPDEFLKELKFREGSSIYFAARKEYLDLSAVLKEQKRTKAVEQLNNKWDLFASYWKATHPVFADVLVSSDARERRQNVIDQMRYLLTDPLTPKASHFDSMKTLVDGFDLFNTERSRLNLNRTAAGRTKVEQLKKVFEEWVTGFVLENPKVNSFWLTVLRPESGLD